MSRIQLAINVDDLAAAIDFYQSLFGTPPAKVREGYANFAIAQPPLKLVLIEHQGHGGTLNHLGIEVESAAEVAGAIARLQAEGMATEIEHEVTCCYAVQDKVWVHGPDGEPWEVYTVLADAASMGPADGDGVPAAASADEAPCCAPAEVSFTPRR